MTTWIKKGADSLMVVGAHPEAGKLLLIDGTAIRAEEALEDRIASEWYEDLKNSIGRSLAWLETRVVHLYASESDVSRLFYCEISGIVRTGTNPVLLLLESAAAQTSCYSGWSDDHAVIDIMNLLDEMVIYGHHKCIEIEWHDQDTEHFCKINGMIVAGARNALLSLFKSLIP